MSGAGSLPQDEGIGGASALVVEWCPSGSLPFFKDHFPGNPIVPAFHQLAYARTLVASWLGIKPIGIAFRSVKFLSPIKPDSRVIVCVEPKGDAKAKGFSFSLTLNVDGTVVTRGEIALS